MASDVTLLPQPDLPTSPSVAPLVDRKIDGVDRMRGATVVAVEGDAQILDFDQRRRRSLLASDRGCDRRVDDPRDR